jgi:sugar phosphate isomerase/epimerase
MTRLGIGSYALAWSAGVPGYPSPAAPLDALGLVRFAAAQGVGLVQIADNLPLGALTADDHAALRAEADRLGVAVEVGTRGIARDHLLSYLGIAKAFDSPILRVVVDTAQHHPTPDEIVATLLDLLPEFESAGVVLAIENHDRFQARGLAQIIEEIGSPQVGICLDTVNSFGALEGPAQVVSVLAPYVVNLHVKDFSIRRADHNMGFVLTGTPAGEGMLNLPWLFEVLNRYGRRYNAILELWTPPQADVDATAALEQQWAEQSVLNLRRYLKD